jgi:predicted enzyme related to lactoylglutathione lyase
MANESGLGSIVHVELRSDEPEKTKAFYRTVFGWKFQEVPGMGYAMIETPSPPGGGLRKTDRGEHAGILNFIRVASVEGTSHAIEKAGGKILVPKTDVPSWGTFSVFQAPGGVVQAIWEASPEMPR